MAAQRRKFTVSWRRVGLLLLGVFVWGFFTPLMQRWTGWNPQWILLGGMAVLVWVIEPIRSQTANQEAENSHLP